MESAFVALSGAAFLFLLVGWSQFIAGARKLKHLSEISPLLPSHALPSVSLVAAARNEARNIEAAVRALLAQDYPNLEIILVNDRSTDETPRILERLAREESRLKVRTIRELPAGWLGKCHALAQGAREAGGEWLLFTDADVVFEPRVLRRAMAYVQSEKLDHLAALPDPYMPGNFLKSFQATFGIFFFFYARPWKARDPKSSAHIGIGAFNLVRAEAYRRSGGFEVIRLRPDDDMKLGKILKKSGARQDLVFGGKDIHVEWYASWGELFRGLEKNSFAGVGYSVAFWIFSVLSISITFLWPYLGLFLSSGGALAMNVLSVLLLLVWGLQQARYMGHPAWTVIFFPMNVFLFLVIISRASGLTLWRGGIQWRGTFYSLKQLKANKV